VPATHKAAPVKIAPKLESKQTTLFASTSKAKPPTSSNRAAKKPTIVDIDDSDEVADELGLFDDEEEDGKQEEDIELGITLNKLDPAKRKACKPALPLLTMQSDPSAQSCEPRGSSATMTTMRLEKSSMTTGPASYGKSAHPRRQASRAARPGATAVATVVVVAGAAEAAVVAEGVAVEASSGYACAFIHCPARLAYVQRAIPDPACLAEHRPGPIDPSRRRLLPLLHRNLTGNWFSKESLGTGEFDEVVSLPLEGELVAPDDGRDEDLNSRSARYTASVRLRRRA
jgi:hypothetical protein